MLVLSRKVGESFTIGSDIVLTVVEVRGNKVRIGVDAPKAFQISRDDMKKSVQQEQQEKGIES